MKKGRQIGYLILLTAIVSTPACVNTSETNDAAMSRMNEKIIAGRGRYQLVEHSKNGKMYLLDTVQGNLTEVQYDNQKRATVLVPVDRLKTILQDDEWKRIFK